MNPDKVKLEHAIRERTKLLRSMRTAEISIERFEKEKRKAIEEVEVRMRKEITLVRSGFDKNIDQVKKEQSQVQHDLRKLGMEIMQIEHDIRQAKK
jgi:hypothetical protein